jgi:hypothetical protein
MSQAVAKPGDCYRLEIDPVRPNAFRWTLTETAGNELIWDHGDKKIVLTTSSDGSGIRTRTATEPDGTMYSYRWVGDVLVFDMDVYEPGCP